MRSSRLVFAAATLAASALLLTACGGDSGSDSSSSSASAGGAATFDPTSIAKDDTIAALLPEKVASAGKLVVGSDTTYAPAEYIDEDGTTPVGYDVDLAKGIAAVLGLKADVQTADFAGIIPAIGSKYDVGISSFTINCRPRGDRPTWSSTSTPARPTRWPRATRRRSTATTCAA